MEKNTNNAAEFIPETQYYSQSKINHRERINFLFTGMKLCICLFLFLDLEPKPLPNMSEKFDSIEWSQKRQLFSCLRPKTLKSPPNHQP